MPALNYTPRNAALVAAGTKPHTIRAMRKRPFHGGDHLIHFTGQRTPGCVRLGESIAAVVMDCEVIPQQQAVVINGITLSHDAIAALSAADGFNSVPDFFAFFKGGIRGQLIGWEWIITPSEGKIETNLINLEYIK